MERLCYNLIQVAQFVDESGQGWIKCQPWPPKNPFSLILSVF